MGAGVAGDALQPARRIDQSTHLLVRLVRRVQLRVLVQRLFDAHAERAGYHPRDAVGVAIAHAERAADVAHGRLRAQRSEGDDLGDTVRAVLLGGEAEHLVAPVVGEIEVDIRHLPPLDVKEALEDQGVGERVDGRHVEAVEDEAGGGRAAHAHGDAGLPGELGDFIDDEEVVDEAGLPHYVQLVLEAAARIFCHRLVATLQTCRGEVRQMLVGADALRQVCVRQVQPAELQCHVARLRDALGVIDRLRQLREARPHLSLRLHVVDRGVHAHAFLVQHRRVGADAEEDVVVGRIIRIGVVAIDRGDERYLRLARQLDELLVHRRHVRQAVLHDLEVVAVEDFTAPARQLQSIVAAAVHEQPVHLAGVAAGERDDPLAVLLQQLAIHARLVVVAFQMRLRRQLQQVAVALLVPRQQRQVVGRFVFRVARTAVAARGIGFDSDDRPHIALPRLAIEVDDAVEHAVVGDGAGLLPQLLRPIEKPRDTGESVQQTVFRV